MVKLNGSRTVTGILRGFDPFMNLVVDETTESGPGGTHIDIGMVVIGSGETIIQLEGHSVERIPLPCNA
uniref:Sm protein G n=1 Tax=Eptatretus burgeri TaxID=7764 RepID=A0A8C4QXB8_EPTBU